jgi:GNAT superfamily N-acetyltransferase
MNDDIIIRPAAIGDCPRFCQLNREALGYDYPYEKTLVRLKLILSRPSDKVYVAECEGIVAGYVHAADYECTYCGPLKNIIAIAVDERLRGLGIGRELLSAAEGWAKECGCEGVRLSSGFARTEAHKFYSQCGYTLRKEQKNFIRLFDNI